MKRVITLKHLCKLQIFQVEECVIRNYSCVRNYKTCKVDKLTTKMVYYKMDS